MASTTVPFGVLCEALSLFFNLQHLSSFPPYGWEAKQGGRPHAVLKLPFPSEAWVSVAVSSSSCLPPLCYRTSQKASQPHKQIGGCLVQSSSHGHDQTCLNTSDGSSSGSSWNPPSTLPLMTHASWITLSEEVERKDNQRNGCIPAVSLPSWVTGPFIFICKMKMLNKMLLMCLFSTHIFWFWRIVLRGMAHMSLRKIYILNWQDTFFKSIIVLFHRWRHLSFISSIYTSIEKSQDFLIFDALHGFFFPQEPFTIFSIQLMRCCTEIP